MGIIIIIIIWYAQNFQIKFVRTWFETHLKLQGKVGKLGIWQCCLLSTELLGPTIYSLKLFKNIILKESYTKRWHSL